MRQITIEDFKQAIHKLDLLQRPYIAFLNPEDAEAVKAALPRIEEEIVIQATSMIEKGKGVVIKREDLESWETSHINDLYEKE